MASTRNRLPRFAVAVLAWALDLMLLAPLLSNVSLEWGQISRVYYEQGADGVDLFLNQENAGYITEVEIVDRGLEVPAGRTIALSLVADTTVAVRTVAAGLAPYLVLGARQHLSDHMQLGRMTAATVLAPQEGGIATSAWDGSRTWAQDREWLRRLYAECAEEGRADVSLRTYQARTTIEIGSCTTEFRHPTASAEPLLVVVSGLDPAIVSKEGASWRQSRRVRWDIVAVSCVRLLLLVFAIGAGPTASTSLMLFLLGQLWRPLAVLSWVVSVPTVVAVAAGVAVYRHAARRVWAAWLVALLVLVLEVGAFLTAVASFDVGTFGLEKITREGDDRCSVVGYSTVRGDSLRAESVGIVERLNHSCAPCRGNTSRFSREAQTLSWVREVVCSPSFPSRARDIVFVGGGNDDIFYRAKSLSRRLLTLISLLRYQLSPVGASDWEGTFNQAGELAVKTIDDQVADIRAIVRCAEEGGRRFWFVHDFLIWDLLRGRTAARQQTFEARRAAVLGAGGQFVDLLSELGGTAGISFFNDWIHPSSAGQVKIADRLCEKFAGDGTPARQPGPSGDSG